MGFVTNISDFGSLAIVGLEKNTGKTECLNYILGQLGGQAERFDAFAKLPHYPFPGGRSLRIPFTAMGAAYYSLRDRLGV